MIAATLSMAVIALSCIAIVIGSFGDWGALTAVPEQAAIVLSTRWIIAGLGCAAAALALSLPRISLAQAGAGGLFLIAGLLAYGEIRYETVQQLQYGVTASRWGLLVVLAGATAGLSVSLVRAVARRRRQQRRSAVTASRE